MAQAKRDANFVPTLIGVSSVDLSTPTLIAVNPTTGALLLDGTSLYTDLDTRYLMQNGSKALTANWDAGSFEIRAQTFQSDVATGTAPLIVASTTKVVNLNADLLDDQTGSYYLDSANFTGTNWTDLTDSGATTLHKHSHTILDDIGTNTHAQIDTALGTTIPATYAVKALSNLASVAINTSLISDTDSTDNLGSTTVAWANLYVDTISSITGNALALTPISGQSLTVNLATTGDFIVNTDDLVVDTSNGNVGIGTTGPGALLSVGANVFQVNSTGQIGQGGAAQSQIGLQQTGTITASGGGAYGINNAMTLAAAANSDSLYGIRIIPTISVGGYTGTTAYGLYINSISGAATNYALYSAATQDSYFAGNVGIGTTGPNHPLDVNGAINIPINTPYRAAGNAILGTVSSADTYLRSYNGDIYFQDSAGSNLAVIKSTGNVGIGTTGPDRKLDILDASNPQLRLSQADGTVYADFQMNSSGDLVIGVDGTTNQLVLDDSGDIGFGTATPTSRFDMRGAAGTGGTARFVLMVGDTTAMAAGIGGGIGFIGKTNSSGSMSTLGVINAIKENATEDNAAGALVFHTRPSGSFNERMRIDSAGNVGIGATTVGAQLHIDQSSTTDAVPVLTVDQADVSEEFIRFIGTSTTDASQSLVDAVDMTTPGTLKGWLKIYVQDDQATNPIVDGVYYVPFYSAPTA